MVKKQLITENQVRNERIYFLTRAIEHGNVDKYSAEREIEKLTEEKRLVTERIIKENAIQIKEDAKKILTEIPTDGDMKRTIARMFIGILKPIMTDSEIKGCFRQGYKIMRGKA